MGNPQHGSVSVFTPQETNFAVVLDHEKPYLSVSELKSGAKRQSLPSAPGFILFSRQYIEQGREDMEIMEGFLGRLGRRCYAVLCLGVLVVSVTVAHYVVAMDQPKEPRERSRRRLRALHGPALRSSQPRLVTY